MKSGSKFVLTNVGLSSDANQPFEYHTKLEQLAELYANSFGMSLVEAEVFGLKEAIFGKSELDARGVRYFRNNNNFEYAVLINETASLTKNALVLRIDKRVYLYRLNHKLDLHALNESKQVPVINKDEHLDFYEISELAMAFEQAQDHVRS